MYAMVRHVYVIDTSNSHAKIQHTKVAVLPPCLCHDISPSLAFSSDGWMSVVLPQVSKMDTAPLSYTLHVGSLHVGSLCSCAGYWGYCN